MTRVHPHVMFVTLACWEPAIGPAPATPRWYVRGSAVRTTTACVPRRQKHFSMSHSSHPPPTSGVPSDTVEGLTDRSAVHDRHRIQVLLGRRRAPNRSSLRRARNTPSPSGAPTELAAGLEPATARLQVGCATNCAMPACVRMYRKMVPKSRASHAPPLHRDSRSASRPCAATARTRGREPAQERRRHSSLGRRDCRGNSTRRTTSRYLPAAS